MFICIDKKIDIKNWDPGRIFENGTVFVDYEKKSIIKVRGKKRDRGVEKATETDLKSTSTNPLRPLPKNFRFCQRFCEKN